MEYKTYKVIFENPKHATVIYHKLNNYYKQTEPELTAFIKFRKKDNTIILKHESFLPTLEEITKQHKITEYELVEISDKE